MTLFWILSALMVLIGVALVAPSLLRGRELRADDGREQNITIARERLREMEGELTDGSITEETFEQAKAELEKGLLDDVSQMHEQALGAGGSLGRNALFALVLVIPLLAIGTYQMLGSPQHLGMAGPGAGATESPHTGSKMPSMEELLKLAEQKAEQNSEDPNAWYMLGRTYTALERHNDAVRAYEKLVEITDNHPTALVSLADALAMVAGGSMAGRPYELILKALEMQPENTVALWLAGNGAVEQGDLQNAVYYWRQAEAGLADEPESLARIREDIARVKQIAQKQGVALDDPGSAVAESASLTIGLKVRVAPELADKVKPGTTLFVFARAVEGRPMPIAAIKRSASELPVELVLDDNALLQGGKLADHSQLSLAARITEGEPRAKSGDLQSASIVASPGQEAVVELVIDQVVP